MASKTQKENRGRSVVQDIVSAEGTHDWQEFAQQNDDGVDGIILYRQDKEKTGEIFFVQVKCGEKGGGYYKEFIKRPDFFGVHLTEKYIQKHVNRWYNVSGPMILVYVDYDSRDAWWTDLRNRDSFSEENKQIVLIPKRQTFGTNSFKELRSLYLKNFNNDNFFYASNKSINNLNDELKDKSVLDALVAIKDKFDPFHVIPNHILGKLFPFRSDDLNAEFIGSDLRTSNSKLIDFFSKLKNDCGNYTFDRKQKLPFSLKKLKKAIFFLKANEIKHLYKNRTFSNRICIHYLFAYHNCTCFKCSIGKLDFNKTISSYNSRKKNQGLDYANSLFELGLYEESFIEFDISAQNYKIESNYSGFYIANYNLSKMSAYIDRYAKEYETIVEIKARIIVGSKSLEKMISSEEGELINWVDKESYINNEMFLIDSIVKNILKDYENDKLGIITKFGDPTLLHDNLVKLSAFIHGNNLIFSHYREYHQTILYSLEGLLASYSIKNFNEIKIKFFDDDILTLVINYLSTEDVLYLLQKFSINKIEYKKRQHLKEWNYVDKIESLKNSIDSINKFLKKKKDIRSIAHFENKLNKQVSNLLLLTAYLNLTKSDFEKSLTYLVRILYSGDFISEDNFKQLQNLIIYCSDRIPTELILDIRNSQNNYKRYWISRHLTDSVLVDLLPKTKEIKKELDSIIANAKKDNGNLDFALNYIDSYSSSQKKKLSLIIEAKLNQNFDFWHWYNAVSMDILDSNKFEKECLKSIPLTSNEFKFPLSYLERAVYNQRLNMFIEMAYKNGKRLSSKKYNCIRIENDYYKWLFSPERFDYSKFNPFWLLNYPSKYYFKKFKKVKVIKDKLIETIKKTKSTGLSEIYFDYFE